MANTQAFCSQAKVDFMNGLHAFGVSVIRAATTKDDFKAALYESTAGDKDATTTVYNTTGEVSGTGYSATGIAVTNANIPTLTSTTGHWTPSADIDFGTVTLTTNFDAVLIYNDTSATKLAISVHTFGDQTVTAGNFTLTMPVDDDTTGLIRFA